MVTSILEKNETTAYGSSSGPDIATEKVTNSINGVYENDENGFLDKPEITLPTKDLKPIDIDIERKSKGMFQTCSQLTRHHSQGLIFVLSIVIWKSIKLGRCDMIAKRPA